MLLLLLVSTTRVMLLVVVGLGNLLKALKQEEKSHKSFNKTLTGIQPTKLF
jgi:hypothetical protein